MYKAAVLGCGPRSHYHAAAYKGLAEMQLVAACDMNCERLTKYGEKFSAQKLYGDLETMLKREKPDILHIVTPPMIREQPLELAAKYGVKGIIVEKPLALTPSQAARIGEIAAGAGLKVAVNTQRSCFSTSQGLRRILAAGKIGELTFVRCVTKGNILSMGPHMLDLLMFMLGGAAPESVWAGARGWNGEDYGHPAPANVLARLTYADGLVVYLEDAADCVGSHGENDFWQHCELDFWGTKGRAWWLQNRDWGYECEGTKETFPSLWGVDEEPGQREFTRALAAWLADDRQVHVCCLKNSLAQFNQIMGLMQSVLTGEKIALPVKVDDGLMKQLEKVLKK